MRFCISDNAKFSFPTGNGKYKTPALIKADVGKIRKYYSRTDDGSIFFSGKCGVEKPEKLDRAISWISKNKKTWAPVIDLRSETPDRISFSDGRHTFVALEKSGYKCISVVVPKDRKSELLQLLGCDPT